MPRPHFGTDGIRGRFGDVLTTDIAYRIGRVLGQHPNGKRNRIVLSMDTRESGPALAEALVRGIVASGGTVYEEGVSTTPSISYLAQTKGFDYGIMISASHNPFYDNGIKIFGPTGEKITPDLEEEIEKYIGCPEDDLPIEKGHHVIQPSLKEEYVSWLCEKASLSVKGLRVVFDLANGSASKVAPEVFKRLKVQATFLHDSPDGKNINQDCGSTHLRRLEEEVKKGHYDLGIAFDGDADRMLAFDGKGCPIDGDGLIYLHALSLSAKGNLLKNQVTITQMSNFGLRKALEKAGISYQIVGVGDKYVQASLKEHGLVLGGEQSGHTIFANYLNTGDGLLSAILLLNLYADEPKVFARHKEFVPYPQILENIPFPDRSQIAAAMERPNIKSFIENEEKALGEEGRILIRPSGTEPLLRVMVEAKSSHVCKATAAKLVKAIKGVS